MINKTYFKVHINFIFILSLLLCGCATPIVSETELTKLQENVQSHPESAAAYANLGLALYYVEQFQKAINTYKESIRLRPDDPETHYNISLAYDEMRDGKNAISSMIESEKLYRGLNDQGGISAAKGSLVSYYSKYDFTPKDFGYTFAAISSQPNPIKSQPIPKISDGQKPQSGTGSGFFASKMGHVITNAHVVSNCNKVTVGDNASKQVAAEIVNTDTNNDLALLKLLSLEMASAESKSLIQKLSIVVVPLASKGLLRSQDVKLGEKVLVAGYPFGDAFSSSIKVTTGVVSSTRGVGDDSGQFQLDAAVQPGNSGGPIYDSGGNIVGVVISQLNKKTFGSLVENVNFGIKASTVRKFLILSGLPSKKVEQTDEKSTEDLANIAEHQALMVMCLQ
jgi:S1-C subfamily serine protease